MITAEHLRIIAGRKAVSPLMPKIADAMNRYAADYGVTRPDDLAKLLANSTVETAGFTTLEENLNYSAERLTKVWPKRFPTLADAKPFARNPEALANRVYGGRLGNDKPGDGWNYRGSGVMQTTGKANFAAVQKATELPVVNNPDILRNSAEAATIAALVFWRDNGLSNVQSIDMVRRRVNGGTHGLDEVRKAYARALKLNLAVPAAKPRPVEAPKPVPAPLPPATADARPVQPAAQSGGVWQAIARVFRMIVKGTWK